MNKLKLYKYILIIIAVAFLINAGIFSYLNSPPVSMDQTIVTVAYGATITSIAQHLKLNHCITSKNFFKAMSVIKGRRSLKSGRYKIYRGMTTLEIITQMTKGKILTSRITIPEGFNIYQIGKRYVLHQNFFFMHRIQIF
jgi:UPF0755 protein